MMFSRSEPPQARRPRLGTPTLALPQVRPVDGQVVGVRHGQRRLGQVRLLFPPDRGGEGRLLRHDRGERRLRREPRGPWSKRAHRQSTCSGAVCFLQQSQLCASKRTFALIRHFQFHFMEFKKCIPVFIYHP